MDGTSNQLGWKLMASNLLMKIFPKPSTTCSAEAANGLSETNLESLVVTELAQSSVDRSRGQKTEVWRLRLHPAVAVTLQPGR